MLNYFRKDFASVRMAIKMLTNGKAPDWAIVIWYIVIAPFGFLLLPFAILFQKYLLWKIEKELKKFL